MSEWDGGVTLNVSASACQDSSPETFQQTLLKLGSCQEFCISLAVQLGARLGSLACHDLRHTPGSLNVAFASASILHMAHMFKVKTSPSPTNQHSRGGGGNGWYGGTADRGR